MEYYSAREKSSSNSGWMPADERNFIRSLADPKQLKGYLKGLPLRKRWPRHFTVEHTQEFKDLAKSRLLQMGELY
ncbi:hypothetical protein [uncultured Mediterranean phage uvMED]|nr:hypothetical protein [uncultured Mediterranean phage uvMED]